MSEQIKALAGRVADVEPSWLPICGHVVNITFSLGERDLIVRVLQEASLPTLARTMSEAERRSMETATKEIDSEAQAILAARS